MAEYYFGDRQKNYEERYILRVNTLFHFCFKVLVKQVPVSCMRQFKLSKIWKRALVVAISKPNKALEDTKNYRPISLLASSSRYWRELSMPASNQL